MARLADSQRRAMQGHSAFSFWDVVLMAGGRRNLNGEGKELASPVDILTEPVAYQKKLHPAMGHEHQSWRLEDIPGPLVRFVTECIGSERG